jgi:hypothetical protein
VADVLVKRGNKKTGLEVKQNLDLKVIEVFYWHLFSK